MNESGYLSVEEDVDPLLNPYTVAASLKCGLFHYKVKRGMRLNFRNSIKTIVNFM